MRRLAGGEPVSRDHSRPSGNAAQCLLAYGSVAWVVLQTRVEERHPEADRPTLRTHVSVMRDGAVGTEGQPARLRIFTHGPMMTNVRALVQELAILGPIVAALWLVRVKALAGLASQAAGRDHPPQ